MRIPPYWTHGGFTGMDRSITRDKRNEDVIQIYLEKMTGLMVDDEWLDTETKDVPGQKEGENITLSRTGRRLFLIARIMTVWTLRALDRDLERQTKVIEFLRKSDLLDGTTKPALFAKALMTRIDLRGLDLHNANLYQVDFGGAILQGANLQSTNLQEANLAGAILRKADLRAANLQEADLGMANLQAANFWKANLRGVDLDAANLKEADLGQVECDEKTILPDDSDWAPDSDLTRFTDRAHPEFWESPYATAH